MKRASFAVHVVLGSVLVAAACDVPTVPDPHTPSVPVQAMPAASESGTPLQARIAQSMAMRAARGESTPAAHFEFTSAQGSSLQQLRARRYLPGGGFSYTATTTLHYRGPADAGLKKWPDMSLTKEASKKLGVTSEEFRARYMAAREAANPGIWQRYELGMEPRSYTITETETRTWPASNAMLRGAGPSALRATGPIMAGVVDASSGVLVFGFSVILPKLEKHESFSFLEVQTLYLDFEATAGAGLRLPMSGALSGDEPVNEGDTFSASSAVTGENWSGAQYAGVGLPAQDGNEAYFEFKVEGCVNLDGIVDPDKQCLGPTVYESTDFTTPLGAGNLLPLPTINVPIIDYGIIGLDFTLKSGVGSDKVSADWNVGAEGMGSGTLEYTNSGTAVTLAGAYAIDGPGEAVFTVDNFKYWFNQFSITPGVKVWVDVTIPFFPEDLHWGESWNIDIITINLFDLLPLPELAIPVHDSPYNGGSSMSLGIDILNVAPTADLTLAGGTTMIINGIETVVGNTGETFSFTGSSHDPGRDGLTLSFDWGDGAPAPDESQLFPLAAAIGPNDAAWTRTHAFSRSCMYEVTFRSVDDDDASATDNVSILVTESGKPARLEGYWQKQYAQSGGSLLDVAVLTCYLRIIDRVSVIFNEVRAASTLAEALAVLNLPRNAGSEREQLDREILVLWLNFAAGAVQYQELVDTDGDGTPDTPFDQLMQTAEALRLNPAATVKELRAMTELLHKISEMYLKP